MRFSGGPGKTTGMRPVRFHIRTEFPSEYAEQKHTIQQKGRTAQVLPSFHLYKQASSFVQTSQPAMPALHMMIVAADRETRKACFS